MKRLVKKNSFKMLLSENTTKATACLIREILKLVETEKKLEALFRTLHYTRFQLQIIHASPALTVEMGEKCVRTTLCHWHGTKIAGYEVARVAPCSTKSGLQSLLDGQSNRLGRTPLRSRHLWLYQRWRNRCWGVGRCSLWNLRGGDKELLQRI